MAAIESNNAAMNPGLHLVKDEIVALEMKLGTQCSKRLKFRNPNDERSTKLRRVDSWRGSLPRLRALRGNPSRIGSLKCNAAAFNRRRRRERRTVRPLSKSVKVSEPLADAVATGDNWGHLPPHPAAHDADGSVP